MKVQLQYWIKPLVTLSALCLITWLAPVTPLDRWSLINPKKISTMILALAMIQAFGSTLAQYLGTRTGSILTGFLGGIISSTATTASLARQSTVSSKDHNSEGVLVFLSATVAMLFEGFVLVIAGMSEIHLSTLLIFIGPFLSTLLIISLYYKNLTERTEVTQDTNFLLLPILKLSVFIVAILAISKIFQNLYGENGLLAVTTLASLFEIHGSLIVNVQLHESNAVSVRFLNSLLAISVASSYVSKLFLIWTLGSPVLRLQAIKSTLYLFLSLTISWIISMNLA